MASTTSAWSLFLKTRLLYQTEQHIMPKKIFGTDLRRKTAMWNIYGSTILSGADCGYVQKCGEIKRRLFGCASLIPRGGVACWTWLVSSVCLDIGCTTHAVSGVVKTPHLHIFAFARTIWVVALRTSKGDTAVHLHAHLTEVSRGRLSQHLQQ